MLAKDVRPGDFMEGLDIKVINVHHGFNSIFIEYSNKDSRIFSYYEDNLCIKKGEDREPIKGDTVMVTDYDDELQWEKRIFIEKRGNRFTCVEKRDEENFRNKKFYYSTNWNYCKLLQEPRIEIAVRINNEEIESLELLEKLKELTQEMYVEGGKDNFSAGISK